jgi:hypothetical protein
MGLRQWLSFVAAWIIELLYTDVGKVHYFVPLRPALYLKPLMAKLAVPTPIYLF